MLPEKVDCPRCERCENVRRKLLTSPIEFKQPDAESGHLHIGSYRTVGSGHFLNGYFCDSCAVGFVTRELLREAGTDEFSFGWDAAQAQEGTLKI